MNRIFRNALFKTSTKIWLILRETDYATSLHSQLQVSHTALSGKFNILYPLIRLTHSSARQCQSTCVHVCKSGSGWAVKKQCIVDTGISEQIRNTLSTQGKAFLWALGVNFTANTNWRQNALPLSINNVSITSEVYCNVIIVELQDRRMWQALWETPELPHNGSMAARSHGCRRLNGENRRVDRHSNVRADTEMWPHQVFPLQRVKLAIYKALMQGVRP